MKNITIQRLILIILWVLCFGTNILMLFVLKQKAWIGSESFTNAVKEISSIYSPFLGIMLLFFWTKRSHKRHNNSILGFMLTLVSSIIWNAIIVFLIYQLFSGDANIEDQLAETKEISSTLSWLIAGVTGYYFAKS